MELLYLYILFYLLFILFTKNKSKKGIFLCTLIMYLSSSIASLYIYNTFYKGYPILLEAVIYHILMLFLLLYPLQRFDKYKYLELPKVDYKKISFLSNVIIVLCLFKMVLDLQNININLLFSNVDSLRNALTEGSFIDSNVFFRYIKFFAGQYWSIALVLAFYYMRHFPQKKITITLLLISSLEVIVSGFVVAAREYLIKYVFLFFILMYWYSSSITFQWKRKIRLSFFVLGALFVSFFLIITFLRFGEMSTFDSPLDSMFSYLGQGYIHFSTYFTEFEDGLTKGAIRFPFFAGQSLSAYNLNEIFYTDAGLNSFPTTIGSWYLEVGFIWTIIITLLHNCIFRRIGNKKVSVFNLIYIIWIYDFIFSCMFFYNEVLNGSRILSILLIVVFERTSFNSSKTISIYK